MSGWTLVALLVGFVPGVLARTTVNTGPVKSNNIKAALAELGEIEAELARIRNKMAHGGLTYSVWPKGVES